MTIGARQPISLREKSLAKTTPVRFQDGRLVGRAPQGLYVRSDDGFSMVPRTAAMGSAMILAAQAGQTGRLAMLSHSASSLQEAEKSTALAEWRNAADHTPLGVAAAHSFDGTSMFADRIKLVDTNAQNDYRVNSPAGDYGILYADSTVDTNLTNDAGTQKAGLIFYQAGIAVISASVFNDAALGGILTNARGNSNMNAANQSVDQIFVSGAISASWDSSPFACCV